MSFWFRNKELSELKEENNCLWQVHKFSFSVTELMRRSFAKFLCEFEHCISEEDEYYKLRRDVVVDLKCKLYGDNRSGKVLYKDVLEFFYHYPQPLPQLLGWLLNHTFFDKPFKFEVNHYCYYMINKFKSEAHYNKITQAFDHPRIYSCFGFHFVNGELNPILNQEPEVFDQVVTSEYKDTYCALSTSNHLSLKGRQL